MGFIQDFANNRNLLKNLVVRDLKHRYVGSMGGILWSAINPIVLLVSYSFVFTVILPQHPSVELYGTDSFTIFLFCGLLPWTLFNDTVLRSCSVLIDNAPLVTKTIIPVEILPVAITISTLVLHGIGMAILVVVLAASHSVPLSAIGVLLYVPILLLFAQGLGWIVAGLQVFLRDTIQALQIIMFLGMWLTPVVYPLAKVPEPYRHFMTFNPMALVLTGYRASLLGLPQPAPAEIATAAGISIIVFTLGAVAFRRAKPAFADVL